MPLKPARVMPHWPACRAVLAALIAGLLLTGCGGDAAPEPPPPAVLLASVGGLQGQQLAIGDSASLNGSQPLMGVQSTSGALTAACSGTTLVATRDGVRWQPIALTDARLPQPCVNQMQDVGDFLVIKTIGLLNVTLQSCDLALIRKRDGQTSCIIAPLPERQRSGEPVFGLGLDLGESNRSAQLSANGRFLMVPFNTQANPAFAYAGFLRFDLTASRPSVDLAYLESGEFDASAGSINGHQLTWGAFRVLDNGDLVFTEFTRSSASPDAGTVRQFYAVNTPGLNNPAAVEKYLISVSDEQYRVDVLNSPLGRWVKAQHPGLTALYADSDVLSGPPSDGLAGFHSLISGEGFSADACGNGPRHLIRVRPDRASGSLVFEMLGSTSLGGTHGSRPDGRPVRVASDAASLYGLRWDLAHAGTGKAGVRFMRRSLTAGACDETELTVLSLAVDASVQAQGLALNGFMSETRDTVFLRTFDEAAGAARRDKSCQTGLNCSISSTSLLLAYDKASRTVSNVPLGLLASRRYRLEAAHAMRLGDELSFSLSTADGETRATAVLSSKGLKSLIELPRGVRPASRLVSGG